MSMTRKKKSKGEEGRERRMKGKKQIVGKNSRVEASYLQGIGGISLLRIRLLIHSKGSRTWTFALVCSRDNVIHGEWKTSRIDESVCLESCSFKWYTRVPVRSDRILCDL